MIVGFEWHQRGTDGVLLSPRSEATAVLENGEEIPLGPSVVSQASLKHRHHVFPRAHLMRI
jgi:hypothetical protein